MSESEKGKDQPQWVDGVLEYKTKDGFMRIISGDTTSPYAKWLEENMPKYENNKDRKDD